MDNFKKPNGYKNLNTSTYVLLKKNTSTSWFSYFFKY